MNTKKAVAILTIACVVLTCGLASLAVIPHTHGDDLDHSQHQNCAVYQFSLGHVEATQTVASIIFLLSFLVYSFAHRTTFPKPFFYSLSSQRAPPIA